jgi:hypothetical protein
MSLAMVPRGSTLASLPGPRSPDHVGRHPRRHVGVPRSPGSLDRACDLPAAGRSWRGVVAVISPRICAPSCRGAPAGQPSNAEDRRPRCEQRVHRLGILENRLGSAKTREAELAIRVVGIQECDLEGVGEDGLGFGERDAVTPEILLDLRGIPFEVHCPGLSSMGHRDVVQCGERRYQPRPQAVGCMPWFGTPTIWMFSDLRAVLRVQQGGHARAAPAGSEADGRSVVPTPGGVPRVATAQARAHRTGSVGLTRFGGHCSPKGEERSTDAQNTPTVSTGVPAPDDRARARRALARGAGPEV